MGLIVILVWFGDFVKRHGGSNNFRSGLFDSRLASGNSRFELLREFSRNILISLSFSQTNGGFRRGCGEIPGATGKAGNSASINATRPEDAPDPAVESRADGSEFGSAQVSLRLQPTQHDPVELFGALDIGEMPRVRDFLVAAT